MAKKEKQAEGTPDVESAKLTKLLISEMNKGDGIKIAWNLATDDDNPTDVKEFISTGSTLLDYIITNRVGGGIPVGKLTEISGEESSGKSLIISHLIAETQRRGGIAVYIDTENSANPEFMTRVGVNLKELVYLQPACVEDVGEAVVKTIIMARTRAPNKLVLVAWDGIAATPVRKEIEGDFDLSMDIQLEKSKVLSKMMRKITDTIGKERIALVFTNQLKTKIGVMYGDPMTTPGGKAVPYHSSVRIRLTAGKKKKVEKKGDGDGESEGDIYGVHTSAKIVKNRLGPPWRKCEFDILFASGIDDVNSWFFKLHELGEILKKDGWCYLTSLPSGKIETDGVNEGKDLGVKFRERGWNDFLEKNAEAKKHVISLLEKHMVIRYDQKPHDLDLDPESLMDAESVQQTLEETK